MACSPAGGEARSGEKKMPYESRVAKPRVTNREIYHTTFLLSGGMRHNLSLQYIGLYTNR